jgi:hypothetical protein
VVSGVQNAYAPSQRTLGYSVEMASRIWSALLWAALPLGGACGGSVEPIVNAPGCPRNPVRGPTQYANEPLDRLIDDFESGDGHLALQGGRNGYWVTGSDTTGALVAKHSNECAGRGGWAGHYAAYGWTSWGNNWTAVFEAPAQTDAAVAPAVPYDARAWGGISFWAAFGPFNPADFAVPLGVTTMDNAWNGGICNNNGGCMDYYGTTVPLTHEWRRYVIRFQDLAQSGQGSPLLPMRKDQMVGFIIYPHQAFDLWIDDIRFEPEASVDGGG